MTPSDRAPGLLVGSRVRIADDVQIGAYVVIHSDTTIGAGTQIQDNVVLGKEPAPAIDGLDGLVIEEGAIVGTQATIFRGARLGRGAIVRDQAHVREGTVIGP